MKNVWFSGLSSPALPSAALMPPSAAPEWLRVGMQLGDDADVDAVPGRLDGGAHARQSGSHHHHVVSDHQASGVRLSEASSNPAAYQSTWPVGAPRSPPGLRLCDSERTHFQYGEIAVNLGVATDRPWPFVTFGGDVAKTAFAMPAARRVLRDVPQQELHELAKGMTTARPTNYGAVNVQTTVLSRSTRSTFIVADDPESYPHQAIDRDEWDRVSALQDAYIADQEMIQVDGFIGDDPDHRVPARLFIEARNANIAGMQDVLFFHHPEAGSSPSSSSSTRPTWPCRATRTTA